MELKALLLDYLEELATLRFDARAAEEFVVACLGRDSYDRMGGYPSFVRVIEELENEGRIRPVKRPGKNGLNPPLYIRYQRVEAAPSLQPAERQRLLNRYHPALTLGYYLDHPDDYEKDRPYIEALDGFLKAYPNGVPTPASVNERSFAVFGDEKFLVSPAGRRLLQRLGLEYDRLNCYETFEPFFYFALSPRAENDILIVENKDTFFTLKRHFGTGRHQWSGKDFRLLIYGEGKKIWSSLAYFSELTDFQARQNHFYYFGDLDPEGIAIFGGLAKRYPEYRLQPFQPFYITLLQYARQAPRLRTRQKVAREDEERFLSRFPSEVAHLMQELLAEGRYLPQEALDYAYFAGAESSQVATEGGSGPGRP